VRAHDLFLKFDTYFLRSNSQATVRLLNGSFRASEGVVARATSARTDANGIVRLRLGVAGKWFVKMIHMTPVTNGDVNYESNMGDAYLRGQALTGRRADTASVPCLRLSLP